MSPVICSFSCCSSLSKVFAVVLLFLGCWFSWWVILCFCFYFCFCVSLVLVLGCSVCALCAVLGHIVLWVSPCWWVSVVIGFVIVGLFWLWGLVWHLIFAVVVRFDLLKWTVFAPVGAWLRFVDIMALGVSERAFYWHHWPLLHKIG